MCKTKMKSKNISYSIRATFIFLFMKRLEVPLRDRWSYRTLHQHFTNYRCAGAKEALHHGGSDLGGCTGPINRA